MLHKFFYNFLIAIEAISHNKLRAFLTSLGIIFGVSSVISMLAIGKGAEKTILEQMKLLGANNIIVTPNVEQEEGSILNANDLKSEKQPFTPGLRLADAVSIAEIVPFVNYASPEIVIESMIIRSGLKRTGKLIGVDDHFLETANFEIAQGRFFSDYQFENSVPVCIIGYGIKTRFFAGEKPIGKKIKCGKLWLTVIGVLEERKVSNDQLKKLGVRDYNMDIYAPIKTILLRYKNRAMVTHDDVLKASGNSHDENGDESAESQDNNYHQIDRIIIHIEDNRFINTVADIVQRMLERRHNNVIDFEIVIPQLLIEQEQKTKRIFNIVLGAIASISLIVGGIGVMNIMLASVLDRFREIGVRQAIGASRRDIIMQFISEAVTITVTGGLLGIFLGFVLSFVIEKATGIITVISPISIVISFFVSASVGLIFGIYPAKKAAEQDPVVLLRYE